MHSLEIREQKQPNCYVILKVRCGVGTKARVQLPVHEKAHAPVSPLKANFSDNLLLTANTITSISNLLITMYSTEPTHILKVAPSLQCRLQLNYDPGDGAASTRSDKAFKKKYLPLGESCPVPMESSLIDVWRQCEVSLDP